MYATGVVIAADGPNAAEVDRFTLRTSEGEVLEFTLGRLDLSNGGLPAAHLREHLVNGEPIKVLYVATGSGLVALQYTDASE
jgi:hypothetical protein